MFAHVKPLPVQGLANQTAEKVKPSALDLMLLFKEGCRLKREAAVGTKFAGHPLGVCSRIQQGGWDPSGI